MTKEQWEVLAKHVKRGFVKNQDFLSSREDVELWFSMMRDMDFEQTKKAFWIYMQSCKFPPALADIKMVYNEIESDKERERQQVREIYKTMENYYPVCLRDEDRLKSFSMALKKIDGKDATDKALKIKKRVIKAVEDAEKSGKDDLPTLSECIRGCIDE